MLLRLRDRLKVLLYRGGGLHAYHRVRNYRTLTVAMFHRVLSPSDPRSLGADPEWSMSTDLFRECLSFFRQHYRVISLADLTSHRTRSTGLPPRSLLITFDDGWADTEEYALPILLQEGLPAVVFVTANAIDRHEGFWQEELYVAWVTERVNPSGLARLAEAAGTGRFSGESTAATEHTVKRLVSDLALMEESARQDLFEELGLTFDHLSAPQMLSQTQLRHLHSAGVAIGSHGLTHLPLTQVGDCAAELRDSRRLLAALLGVDVLEVTSLSFPHGKYNEEVLGEAVNAGFLCAFNSESCLNRVDPESASRHVPLGRIHIPSREIVGADGRLRPERLALWMFRRAHRGGSAA